MILVCKSVWFYSPGDERAFFEFAGSIPGVQKIGGVGDEIHIHVPRRLSNASLQEILALFHRYQIDMRQLAEFETATNAKWFRDEQKYWYKRVFIKRSHA